MLKNKWQIYLTVSGRFYFHISFQRIVMFSLRTEYYARFRNFLITVLRNSCLNHIHQSYHQHPFRTKRRSYSQGFSCDQVSLSAPAGGLSRVNLIDLLWMCLTLFVCNVLRCWERNDNPIPNWVINGPIGFSIMVGSTSFMMYLQHLGFELWCVIFF